MYCIWASYHLFAVEGRKFIVLALEFGPRKDIVRWANDVMDRHQDREAILITHAYTTPDGRSVHQLLVNFQMRPNGGDGWLRLLEFRADSQTIQVVDYSQTRNQHNQSPQNQFELKLSAVG